MYLVSRCTLATHYPDSYANSDPVIPEVEMNAFIGTVIDLLPVSDTKRKEIIEAQEDDEVCKRIKQYCLEGWPD